MTSPRALSPTTHATPCFEGLDPSSWNMVYLSQSHWQGSSCELWQFLILSKEMQTIKYQHFSQYHGSAFLSLASRIKFMAAQITILQKLIKMKLKKLMQVSCDSCVERKTDWRKTQLSSCTAAKQTRWRTQMDLQNNARWWRNHITQINETEVKGSCREKPKKIISVHDYSAPQGRIRMRKDFICNKLSTGWQSSQLPSHNDSEVLLKYSILGNTTTSKPTDFIPIEILIHLSELNSWSYFKTRNNYASNSLPLIYRIYCSRQSHGWILKWEWSIFMSISNICG